MTAARFRPDLQASFVAALCAVLSILLAPLACAGEKIEISTGEIAGAKFAIARPANWNRNLLLVAHGFRTPESALEISVDEKDPTYARLLAEGWMVAATSYRRNGIVVRDAIADLDALRDHIEKTAGTPSLVILLGESMGGAIVTIMAETEPERYHGAVAIGAALSVSENSRPIVLTHAPKIPIIFLTNQSELEEPTAYVAATTKAPVSPALWTIARDGHVNVNDDERTRALEGLITWITTNQIERRLDATMQPVIARSQIIFENGAGRGAVQSVTENYGNVFTTFQPADFAKLGIARGDTFELTAGGKNYRVFFGKDYNDVPRGEWVAFLRAEGVIMISRNFGNAATTAGLKAGDALVVRPMKR